MFTGNKPIIEASPIDNYWEAGKDGTNQNKLGEIIMATREILHTGTIEEYLRSLRKEI